MSIAELPSPQIAVAQPVMRRINAMPPGEASAINAAIRSIGKQPGEPIDLPNARPGTPYLAQVSGVPGASVVIYRQTQPGEQGNYLVVGLLTPDEYRQQKKDEQNPVLRDLAVRRGIATLVGTGAVIAVTANPGTAASQNGAAPASATDT